MKRVEREAIIARLVASSGRVTVLDLSKRFDVSEVTIRNDLKDLEEKGVLVRTYGGATTRTNVHNDARRPAASAHEDEKIAIAEIARERIMPGSWIFLGPGTTCLALANVLLDREVSVVTNNLPAALALATNRKARVVVTGGIVGEAPAPYLYGESFEQSMNDMVIDIAFLGVDGIDRNFGYSFVDTVESAVFTRVCKAAKHVVVITDASKFGETSFRGVRNLSVADEIITCGALSPEYIEWCSEMNLQLTVADVSATN